MNDEDKGEGKQFMQPFIDVSEQYQLGFSPDPLDKRPFEQSARCYYCQASFSIESQVKNFLCSGRVLNVNQQNVKLISR